ncbi:hypothetical protein XAP3_0018 [Xanthomonas phage XAP3]|nr:hypothetical protein XAP3_0018 [Xanthomonas phage XAP3]
MPKRKVLQTVIVHRDGQRIRPLVGAIFDFTADELASINAINPDALGKPVMEVDVENEDARLKAAAESAKAEADAKADAAKAAADKKNGNKSNGKKAVEDDEV